jgi:hypothetical protein
MTPKIEGAENVRDIFCIFHDGSISSWAMHGNELNLEVKIQYLAERVNPEFRKFAVRLFGVSNVRFSTWPGDLKSAPVMLTKLEQIFEGALEILQGDLKEGEIEVVCNQPSSELDYCGGELRFGCTGAEVTDEAGKAYSIEELDVLCRGYWNDWSKQGKA